MGILFKKHNNNSSIFDLIEFYQMQKHTYFTLKEILTETKLKIKK